MPLAQARGEGSRPLGSTYLPLSEARYPLAVGGPPLGKYSKSTAMMGNRELMRRPPQSLRWDTRANRQSNKAAAGSVRAWPTYFLPCALQRQRKRRTGAARRETPARQSDPRRSRGIAHRASYGGCGLPGRFDYLPGEVTPGGLAVRRRHGERRKANGQLAAQAPAQSIIFPNGS
jgi:hypothetical protein